MSLMCDCHVFIIYIVAICWTVREQNLCQCEARLNALSAICRCAITRTCSGGLVMLQVLPRRCRCVSDPSRPASPPRFISATTRRAHPCPMSDIRLGVTWNCTDISDNNLAIFLDTVNLSDFTLLSTPLILNDIRVCFCEFRRIFKVLSDHTRSGF